MSSFKRVHQVFLLPFYALQLATSAKSFLDNPLIGSPTLNRLGLLRGRMRLAGRICAWRRKRLSASVPRRWREDFDRDGFVVVENCFASDAFERMRSSILNYQGPAREMVQGNAVTRRMAVDPAMLNAIPELRDLFARADLNALFHYVSGFRTTPLHYIQTIVTSEGGAPDPQETFHADTFHSSLKAWLFLNPVTEDQSPFCYVPGSHKLDEARLDWEYRRSIGQAGSFDRLSARGSPRVDEAGLKEMGLPGPRKLAVPANTLVVADTLGFHARGAASVAGERVEIWSYARRNPFLPWTGGDILSTPGIAERRINMLWRARDMVAGLVGQPWRKAGIRTPTG